MMRMIGDGSGSSGGGGGGCMIGYLVSSTAATRTGSGCIDCQWWTSIANNEEWATLTTITQLHNSQLPICKHWPIVQYDSNNI